jgi:uncharacterized protein YifE (UPF0438 family)
MTGKIDYKKQLEKLKEAVEGWRVDKILGNTFTEYDRGHREATLKNSKDFIAVIEMALKGEL